MRDALRKKGDRQIEDAAKALLEGWRYEQKLIKRYGAEMGSDLYWYGRERMEAWKRNEEARQAAKEAAYQAEIQAAVERAMGLEPGTEPSVAAAVRGALGGTVKVDGER